MPQRPIRRDDRLGLGHPDSHVPGTTARQFERQRVFGPRGRRTEDHDLPLVPTLDRHLFPHPQAALHRLGQQVPLVSASACHRIHHGGSATAGLTSKGGAATWRSAASGGFAGVWTRAASGLADW